MKENKIIEIDKEGYINLDLTNEEQVKLIGFYHDQYYNTNQPINVFSEEYFHLTCYIIKGRIPSKLEHLNDYKALMIEEFPELQDVIREYIKDEGANATPPISANGRPIKIGSIVMNSPKDEYGPLVGIVTDIKLLGSPNRDTVNDTDDVYCNFEEFEYSEERIIEINKLLTDLYQEERTFDDVGLDMVIMDPESLIVIDSVPENILQNEDEAENFWEQEIAKAKKGNK